MHAIAYLAHIKYVPGILFIIREKVWKLPHTTTNKSVFTAVVSSDNIKYHVFYIHTWYVYEYNMCLGKTFICPKHVLFVKTSPISVIFMSCHCQAECYIHTCNATTKNAVICQARCLQ